MVGRAVASPFAVLKDASVPKDSMSMRVDVWLSAQQLIHVQPTMVAAVMTKCVKQFVTILDAGILHMFLVEEMLFLLATASGPIACSRTRPGELSVSLHACLAMEIVLEAPLV